MATTEQRIRQLVSENLEVDGQPVDLSGDLNTGLGALGVSSLDVVAFAKLVSEEFNITFTIEDCETVDTIQKLIDHIGRLGLLSAFGRYAAVAGQVEGAIQSGAIYFTGFQPYNAALLPLSLIE